MQTKSTHVQLPCVGETGSKKHEIVDLWCGFSFSPHPFEVSCPNLVQCDRDHSF